MFVGIDGCRGGWLFCYWDGSTASPPSVEFKHHIDELDLDSILMAAIDIPIGFLDCAVEGGREAEKCVRKFLPGKTSSVFSAPCRSALEATGFDHALELNRASSSNGRIGLSRQSAAIIPKMREVDGFMNSSRQSKLIETHPEAAFAIMNRNVPVLSKKRKPDGQAERRGLLKANGFPIDELRLPRHKPKCWSTDDIIDACACAWVAMRVSKGDARRFPPHGNSDAKGLRMAISA